MGPERPSATEQAAAVGQLVESVKMGLRGERVAGLIDRSPEPQQVGHHQTPRRSQLVVGGAEHVTGRHQAMQQHERFITIARDACIERSVSFMAAPQLGRGPGGHRG